MNAIILAFDEEMANDLLTGKRTHLAWIKNFKRPVDYIVVSLKTPSITLAIGYIKVEAKAFISKYTASDRIILADGSVPSSYWYDFEKVQQVCLFRLSDRYLLDKPVTVYDLSNRWCVGSGIYIENELPEGRKIADEEVI